MYTFELIRSNLDFCVFRMAMELHMVHKSKEGHLAVIGVLFREGAPNAFISRVISTAILCIYDTLVFFSKRFVFLRFRQITDKINSIADVQGGEASIGKIDPREFGWDLTKFYEYSGSLTTPPCTEDVMWTIINKVGTVSHQQISALVDARRGVRNLRLSHKHLSRTDVNCCI